MQFHRESWIAGCAGLGALALCGLLLAQPGQDASGQGRAGGAREGEVGGGQDKQMLVAHGLAMAIEGSTLQALAAELGGRTAGLGTTGGGGLGAGRSGVEGLGAGTGTGTGAGRTGDLGVTGGSGITPSGEFSPTTGTSGTGTARPGGTDVGATSSARVGGAGVGDPRGTPSVGGGVPSLGWSATELYRHAVRSFEASDRLFREASQGGAGSADRFQTASQRYAKILRSLGGLEIARRGAGSPDAAGAGTARTDSTVTRAGATSTSGSPATAGTPGAGGAAGSATATGPGNRTRADEGRGMTDSATAATVAVLNQGVKEALDSMHLKRLVRTMGSPNSAAARALLAHSREMDAESQQTIESVITAANARRGERGAAAGERGDEAGGQDGPTQMLANQAREILTALREMSGEGQPGGDEGQDRGGADSKRGTSKSDEKEKEDR